MSLDKGSVGKTDFIEEHGLWSQDKLLSLEIIEQVKKIISRLSELRGGTNTA